MSLHFSATVCKESRYKHAKKNEYVRELNKYEFTYQTCGFVQIAYINRTNLICDYFGRCCVVYATGKKFRVFVLWVSQIILPDLVFSPQVNMSGRVYSGGTC